jgi:hypothetical protein
MFFLEGVIFGTRIRIPAIPELLYEAFTFLGGFQALEERPFFVGNNVSNIFVEPFLVILGQARFTPLGDTHNAEAGDQNDNHDRKRFPEYHISLQWNNRNNK